MNCAEFDAELNQIFDRRATDELAVLQSHAEQCAVCRQALEQARALMEAIPVWRRAVPEVDLVDAVVLACAGELRSGSGRQEAGRSVQAARDVAVATARSRRQRRTISATLVALSSMLLLAVYLLSGSPESSTVVETRPAPDRQGPDRSSPHRLGPDRRGPAEKRSVDPELALLGQAEDAYGRLAKSAAGALEEFALIVIPGAGGATPSGRTSDSADEPLLEGLQQQLQPIGRSLGDALDFLWEVGTPPADSRT